MIDPNKYYKTRGDVYSDIIPGRIVVEVGVFAGDNAKAILRHKPAYLYLLDTWTGTASSGNEHGEHRTTVDLARVKKTLQRELYGEPVTFAGPSPDGFKEIDIQPDVIYIDADHTYGAVLRDIILAYHALNGRNGIIGGHDYCKRTQGVIDAVNDFVQSYKLPRPIITGGPIPSFFVPIR